MTIREYEYKSLMAQAWDVFRGDTTNWEDRTYYLQIIEKYGQPVLDVGCGTGRLLLDYLSLGIDIDGLDNSPEMLDICKEKAGISGLKPVLIEQYLENLKLPRSYKTILIPSSSLQLITEPEEAAAVLRNLKSYLLPGGVIAASIMMLWQDGDPFIAEYEKTAVRESDGAVFRQVGQSRYDCASECEHTEDRYQMIVGEEILADELHKRSPATRSYTQDQARELFLHAGFSAFEIYSQFTWNKVKPEDTLFTIIAAK